MASWLLVIILAYLFFSLSFLGDKLILSGSPKPKLYTFYISLLSVLVIFVIPFIKFGFPDFGSLIWIILEAIVYILGLYMMFLVLEKCDVSVVITAIGATQPIFIFLLALLFFGPEPITLTSVLAFMLLLVGSIIISIDKKFQITRRYIVMTMLASLLFSLDYVFSKLIFLHQPFIQGFIWMRIASFVLALAFLASKDFRKEIFQKKSFFDKKTSITFLCTQASGGIANILQSFAIFLAPVAFLPIVNALRGVQYVFLFLIVAFLSYFFPAILKENMAKRLIVQKIISILLIGFALALLALY